MVLVSIGVITGRELECSYGTCNWYSLWPEFQYCKLSEIDLSKSFESQVHSFTGSTSQKSWATAVWFLDSSQIDFIPKQILEEFPNLNGLIIYECNLPVLKNDLFPEEFVVLEYLKLGYNKIISIEPFAFQNLENLKWLSLEGNEIQSLPFNLFQKNPKLFYLDFIINQINSISPSLLKNLNQLKRVHFYDNKCVDENFGCSWCTRSISQSDLDSGLSTCFQNCLVDPDCVRNSELVERTTETEKQRDPIQTTPQVTTTPPPEKEDLPDSHSNPNPTLQSPQTNLTQELAKNLSEQLKSTVEKLEAKTATLNQVLQVQHENLVSLNQSVASEVTAIKKTVADFRELVRKSEDTCKAETEEVKKMVEPLLDLERKDRELILSKCANDKLARDFVIAELKQEIKNLRKESQDQENALKLEFDEIISKKLEEFELKHKNEARS